MEDGVGSQTVRLEIWSYHWLQNLVPIRYSTEMTSNGDKPCSASVGDAPTQHDAAPTKSSYSINATVSTAFSVSSLCFVQSAAVAAQVLISPSTSNQIKSIPTDSNKIFLESSPTCQRCWSSHKNARSLQMRHH